MRERNGLMRALARATLRLYPAAWRERYADEVGLVLQQHRVTPWTVLDFLIGALDAHLRADLLPRRLLSMAHRIRTSEITVFCAFVLFALSWWALRTGVRDPLPLWEHETTLHPELLTALLALDAAGTLALLAILVGGLPLLFAAIRSASRARRWGTLALLGVPFLAVAALVVYALLASGEWTASSAHPTSDAPFTPLAVVLQLGFLVLFLVAVAGSVAAIARVVAGSEPSEQVVRFALAPAAIATVGIVAGCVAAVALTVLSYTEAPSLYSPGASPIVVGLMALTAVLAAVALGRGLRARRDIAPAAQ